MKNIISIVLILAAIGIIFGYIKPQYSVIMEQRKEIASYNETLEQAKNLEKQVADFQSRISALNPQDMGKLERLLPDTISNVNLIIDISTIAANSGLSIRDIGIAQAKSEDTKTSPKGGSALYDSIDLSFRVTSSYQTFQDLMVALERSLRLVDITSVSFAPGETPDRYDFKVTLRTYWLK